MSLRKALFFLVAAVLVAAPGAYAQEYSPIRWNIHGGFTEPASNASTYLTTGWDFGFGVTFRQPGQALGLRWDFDFASNNLNAFAVQRAGQVIGNVNGGWVDIWNSTLDVEFQHLFTNAMYGYGLGGIGVYYSGVQLTGYGTGIVCNPWWGYCYPYAGNGIVASNWTTKFGLNAGGGLAFRLQSGATLFIEARYTWIEGSPNFEYIPITFGIKF